MYKKTHLFLMIVLTFQGITFAQNSTRSLDAHYSNTPFSHINISTGISTLGLTLEAATPLTKHLKIRMGIDYFNFDSSTFSIDMEDPSGFFLVNYGYEPTLRAKAGVDLIHGHAIVDYFPFEKGIFYLSAGIYTGKTKITAQGGLFDLQGNPSVLLPNGYNPTIDFDGHIIDFNNGQLDAELQLGNTVKPYIGIGLGRTISKRKFGIKFDLGILYSGDYKIMQNGKLVTTGEQADVYIEDAKKYSNTLRWYPKLSMQLNYRLF